VYCFEMGLKSRTKDSENVMGEGGVLYLRGKLIKLYNKNINSLNSPPSVWLIITKKTEWVDTLSTQ